MAATLGWSPTSRLTLAVAAERTHLKGGASRDGDVISTTRGGTLYLGTAEVRFLPLGRDRVGPFLLGGFGAGISRPNVNATFPTRVTNDVQALVVGGGLLVPLRPALAVVADARFIGGSDGLEGIVAVAPLRIGVAWRF